ncbi:MAG: DUF370 domain-containing protein [Clostridia bacterium]|nr:DUF370 domain-containing protein [Clostridia bacterium]MBQ2939923.1 DUF370 domain-containing protein [Clostridia bacterium]
MYLHLGGSTVVLQSDIIGIFDMDNTTVSPHTRKFLNRVQKEGEMEMASEDIPKSFVFCQVAGRPETVYLSQLNPATLQKRVTKTFMEEAGGAL